MRWPQVSIQGTWRPPSESRGAVTAQPTRDRFIGFKFNSTRHRRKPNMQADAASYSGLPRPATKWVAGVGLSLRRKPQVRLVSKVPTQVKRKNHALGVHSYVVPIPTTCRFRRIPSGEFSAVDQWKADGLVFPNAS